MVVGTLDHRIRDGDDFRIGTVVGFTSEKVIVLLMNGDLWVGPKREVVIQNES